MEFKKGDKINFTAKDQYVPTYNFEVSKDWAKENNEFASDHCIFEKITDNPSFTYDGIVMGTTKDHRGIELVIVRFKDPNNSFRPMGILAFEKNGLILIEEPKIKEEVVDTYQIW